MKAEGWQQIDKFFQIAVELDPARRYAFLDSACDGDQSLRDEIESLLTADLREWDFIERPALESAAVLFDDEQPRLEPGQHVGRYEILRLIGKGGMGEVYLAVDPILKRNIALKLLPFYYTQNEGRLRRFQREAQAASALNHPNIITIHELGSFDDQQFIATEFIEGETLRKHIERGPLPVTDAIDIAIQTAGALSAAHKAGIVHRDIKPENIMLRPDGYVKVLDFGLAKLAEQSEPHSIPVLGAERLDISSGILLGTLRYMSPEQVSGLAVDARSDIFSLGVVLYEMVTARPPFDDKDRSTLAESILKCDPPALGKYLDAVPDRLVVVFAKMLGKDRDCRYHHAEELRTDLKLVKADLALEARSSELTRWRPRPAIAFMIVVAFASVIGYLSFNFLRGTTASAPTMGSLNAMGTWTTKASISSPRWQAEPAVLNGVLYVAGGWNVCTPFANLESYDPASNTWTQRAPMLTARGGHGVGVLDGRLFVVGGSVDCRVHISSVEAYDPITDTWSAKTSLPSARFGHAVAVANGKLYAMGGMSSDESYISLNTQYDPAKDSWTEKAPLPMPRMMAAVAVVDGIIYLIGGSGSAGSMATVDAYDPETNSWSSRRPMLLPRMGAAASEADGIIYVLGGSHVEVEAYDPRADTWTPVAKMPTRSTQFHAATLEGSIYFAGGSDGVNYLSNVMAFTPESKATILEGMCPTSRTTAMPSTPTERTSMTVGEIDGIIYAAGGFENKVWFSAANEAYDPVANKWTSKAPMPGARETRGTNNAVVDGKLYVIGGNARGHCSNLNEAYDPETDSWTTKAPMPTPRCHLAVIALNGLVYAMGGTNTSGSIEYSTVEVYNPSADVWTTAAPMPTARQDLGAVSMNGVVYALGGGNPALSQSVELNTVEAYDPASNTWTIKAAMPTPRAGFATGVLNGSLVVVGGQHNETPSAAVETYDPVSNAWTTLTNVPTARSFSSAVTMNNTLFIMGGIAANSLVGSPTANDAVSIAPCSNQS